MPRKGKISRPKTPASKRRLNRGLLVLGGSVVVILGVLLVSLLASGSFTKKPSQNTAAAQLAPDFQLTTFDGGKYALSQDQGKVCVIFFMIQPY